MSGTDDAPNNWRFILDRPLPGAYNMAVDMAMTLAASRGEAPPTLRIYDWQVPTISLGFHQSEEDVDLDLCRQEGVDVVFRPTGGRAVLHDHEITYSVVLPPNSPYFSEHIMTVYELVSRCLMRGLRRLGAPADFVRSKKAPQPIDRELATLCYASSAQYEIVIGDKKLVGSAQRRISNGILQHGSILIGTQHLNITRYVAVRDEVQRRRLRAYMERHTVALEQVLSRPIDKMQTAFLIKEAFGEELGISFEESGLSAGEREDALRLVEKFSVISRSS